MYMAKVLLAAVIAALVFVIPVSDVYGEADNTEAAPPAQTEQGETASDSSGESVAEDAPLPCLQEDESMAGKEASADMEESLTPTGVQEDTAPADVQEEPENERPVYQAGERLSDEKERIWFYNIGGGTFGSDMILIESNGRFGLIDTGNRYQNTIEGEDGTVYDLSASEDLYSQEPGRSGKDGMIYMIRTLGVDHLDFIIATHAHSDHIGGIPEIADLLVLDQDGDTHPLIDAATLYLYKQYHHVSSEEDDMGERRPDSWHNDAFFYQALQAMERSGAVMVDVSLGLSAKEGETITADYTRTLEAIRAAEHMQDAAYEARLTDDPYDDRLTLSWEDLRFDLYNLFAAKDAVDENVNSIVTVVTMGSHKVFLGGDINTRGKIEQKLAAVIAEDHGTMDVMKASHHGYNSSNSRELVDLLQPKVIVNPGHRTETETENPSTSYHSLKYYAGTTYGTAFYEVGAAGDMLAIDFMDDTLRVQAATGEGTQMRLGPADGCRESTVPKDGWSGWVKELYAPGGTSWYYFKDGKPQTGWDRISGNWYYFAADGFMYMDQWGEDSTGRYYFDPSGRLVMNRWAEKDGEWYYFDAAGYLVTDGWAGDSAGWCWMDSDGRVTRSAWIRDKEEWYYLKADGHMAAGEWTKDSTGWMWMNSGGKVTRDKWIQDKGEWYYLRADGYMAADEWVKDATGWMYVNSSGRIIRNQWIRKSGEWYYLKANGYMAAGEWAKDSTGWMWMAKSGRAVRDRWVRYDGNWYYLKPNGYMAAGEWARDSKGWMWMEKSGKAAKSRWLKAGNIWYYLMADGYMATGQQTIGDKTYTFDAAGRLISEMKSAT